MLNDGQFLKIRSHPEGVQFELTEIVLQHGYRALYVLPEYFFIAIEDRQIHEELMCNCFESVIKAMKYMLENFGEEFTEERKYARKTKVVR